MRVAAGGPKTRKVACSCRGPKDTATTALSSGRAWRSAVDLDDVKEGEIWRRASQAAVATAACAAIVLGGSIGGSDTAFAVSGGKNGTNSVPISNTDFSGQNLTENDFTKTIMKQCNFDKANLRGVSLFAAYAEGSTFRDADLSFADLEQGNFEDVDFTGAVLEGAQVSAARFERAILDDTDWTDVVLRKDVNQFLCKKAKGTNPKTGADTRESLMCS